MRFLGKQEVECFKLDNSMSMKLQTIIRVASQLSAPFKL